MALSDKNIVITPSIGSSTNDPQIVFTGADASTSANITLRMYPTNNGTLSFEGNAGQLFSITNSFSGTIFSVNDISGIPSIEVLDTGLVKLAQYSGNVLIGTGTDNATDKLQVNGSIIGSMFKGANIRLSGTTSGTVTVVPVAAAGTTTITLPATTGTVVTTGDSGTVTSTMIADGTIVNGDINASAAIAVSKLAASTISGVTLGSNLNGLTAGSYLTWSAGTTYNGSAAATLAVDATTTNTASKVVARDANGDINSRYCNASYVNTSDDVSAGTVTYLMGKFGDNYFRSATAAKVATFISGQTMAIVGNSTGISGTQTANYVYAAPNGSAGAAAFRALVAADIPTLNQNTTGSAGSLSGTQTAKYVYAAPNAAAGAASFRALVASDIPTLNQNTTGTAGGLTGTPNITVGTIVSTTHTPSANVTYNLGSTTAWWNLVYGKSVQAQYADLAENYVPDKLYEPGTVVVFGGDEEITTTVVSHDTRVAGVISTDPAYLMNAIADGLPVAMTGRVPCKVKGPVNKGDVLVTSDIPGAAERVDSTKYAPGCVVGKSLGTVDNNDVQTIEVVVGRF